MSLYAERVKRPCDLLVAGLALVVTSPVHAILAVMIRLSSGAPVYYAQERVGRDGRPFRLYKFRSMRNGTHEATGGYPSADMVTPVGRVMRKTSLDEIPQLWNIVRGDMSVVGPRPALPDQVSRYTEQQRGRLAVRPGLTGLAQVRYRNNAPWSLRIQSDLEYVRTLSLWTDLKVVLQTIPAVVTGGTVKTGQTAAEVDDLGVGLCR